MTNGSKKFDRGLNVLESFENGATLHPGHYCTFRPGVSLLITVYAHFVTHNQADGQLLQGEWRNHRLAHHRQAFASDRYFHGRTSAAGNGYDATSSGGSNFALSNKKLLTRIDADTKTASADNPGTPVPV